MARDRKFPDAKRVRPPVEPPAPKQLVRPGQSYEGPIPAKARIVGTRPMKWKPEFAEIIMRCCAQGMTDAEAARIVGVSPNLIWKWRQLKPELKKAMDHWRAQADERVVRSLYERAIGYTYEAEVIKVIGERVVRVKTLEHVPPDVRAAETWLMNRRAGEWRQKQEVVYSHGDDPRMLTDEELLEIIHQGQPKQLELKANGSRKPGNGTTH